VEPGENTFRSGSHKENEGMTQTLKLMDGLRADGKIFEQVHTHSLDLLENCGIRFHSERARKILSDAGAHVIDDIVQIPGHLVESAMKKAPGTFRLYSRDGKHDLDLNGQQTYYSQDGCAAHTLDFDSGLRRGSTKADIEKMALISDYLEALISSRLRSAPQIRRFPVEPFRSWRPASSIQASIS